MFLHSLLNWVATGSEEELELEAPRPCDAAESMAVLLGGWLGPAPSSFICSKVCTAAEGLTSGTSTSLKLTPKTEDLEDMERYGG